MAPSVLITQCLQNDFVKPLGKYDPLPNQLHVGFEEARRLMGEDPPQGPVALMMQWAYQQPGNQLDIIHIRDWHDPGDSFEAEHFRQFGPHCIRDTAGAAFAFPVEEKAREVSIVNSLGLNDFLGTRLGDKLAPYAGQPVKTGLMGVWTEAKIFFLAYELRSRYPQMDIAVCSALTASSSRTHHFIFLEQLRRILGVKVFSSVGEFIHYLSPSSGEFSLPLPTHEDRPEITFEGDGYLGDKDNRLVRYLFRDCREVRLKSLTGGFSGNLVLSAHGIDTYGHQLVPHVVKIGPQGPIGQEREAFEHIEEVLGNHAPRITAFVDDGTRGALKYRYASMAEGKAETFKNLFCDGLDMEKAAKYLGTVFQGQLGRLYSAARYETVNLLEYYGIIPSFGESILGKVDAFIGKSTRGKELALPNGKGFPNPASFYLENLPEFFAKGTGSAYFSFVHGDLNGANIVIDAQENVWLIDFFHTHRGHVLRDLIKFENDLLYIFTPVNNEAELEEAVKLTDVLMDVKDLAEPLPPVEETGLTLPHMKRTYETLRLLRSFYPALIKHDRNPFQVLVGQLRYAGHTLVFEESNRLQKYWALYTAGRAAGLLAERLKERGPLRVDWLDKKLTGNRRVGVTLLPGRKDYNRSLDEDLVSLKDAGVTHIVTLVSPDELIDYGVENLRESYKQAGFENRYLGIKDQGVSSFQQMKGLVGWMAEAVDEGKSIMIHCVGGLGRSGLAAACYLAARGAGAAEAIAEVRRARSPRAIESEEQRRFVYDFEQYCRSVV